MGRATSDAGGGSRGGAGSCNESDSVKTDHTCRLTGDREW